MKFVATIVAVLAAASMATAQVTAPMKNYNVTSPIQNGPYVAGQILPCTYQILSQNTGLQLSIVLSADPAANFTAVTIINPADVTTTQQFEQKSGNITYWEHQVNYQIPTTTPSGNYYVTFNSIDSGTTLVFNVTIRPAAAVASSTSVINPSGAKTGSGSGTVTGTTAATSVPPNRTNSIASGLGVSKTVLALVGVAAFAATLL